MGITKILMDQFPEDAVHEEFSRVTWGTSKSVRRWWHSRPFIWFVRAKWWFESAYWALKENGSI